MKRCTRHIRTSLPARLSLLVLTVIFSSCSNPATNSKPTLTLEAKKNPVAPGQSTQITATPVDNDGDVVTVTWVCDFGTLSADNGDIVTWTAPGEDNLPCTIIATANDGHGGITEKDLIIDVKNNAPVFNNITTTSSTVLQGNTITLQALAYDPDGSTVRYRWSDNGGGTFSDTLVTRNTATWKAPTGDTWIKVTCTAYDAYGGETDKSLDLLVYSNYGVIWVADSGTDKVYKYSAIGEFLLTVQGTFQRPIAIATNVDEFFGCYVADYDMGQVFKISEKGAITHTYTSFKHPIDIDIFQSLRVIWVLDVGNNSVTAINGYTDQVIGTFTGLKEPRSLKVNQETGDVWITDTGNNRIIRIQPKDIPGELPTVADQKTVFRGTSSNGNGYNEPIHLSFSQHKYNVVYIADISDDEVEMIESSMSGFKEIAVASTGYQNPSFIAVSDKGTSEVVWVIHNTQISTIMSGNLFPSSIDYDTFKYPYRIVTDDLNNKIWVVDNGLNQIIPLDDTGSFTTGIDIITGFVFIEDVAINQ